MQAIDGGASASRLEERFVKRMEGQILDLGREALVVTMKLCAPALLLGLAAGVLVSVFQAATQLQEPTLTFVPKIIAVGIALLIFGAWMLATIGDFTNAIYTTLPQHPL
jgi:flagellar biosynthetic protein FliQ